MIHIYIENERYRDNIQYAFETLLRCIHENDITFHAAGKGDYERKGIYYGNVIQRGFPGIVIREGDFFSGDYLSEKIAPVSPLKRYRDIPVIFSGKDQDMPTIIQSEINSIISFDIVQGTFYLVTGCEEIIFRDIEHDAHSRFLVKNRLLYKENFLHKPIVNMYAKLLRGEMERLGFSLNQQIYPAYAHISHDVDNPYRHTDGYFKYARKLASKMGVRLKERLQEGFEYIKGIEIKNGLKSSWYFMAGGNNSGYEYGYDFAAPLIQSLRQRLQEGGDELGWHYSYNAADDYIQMKKESDYYMRCVGEKPTVGRNHYLRYSIPETWRTYARLGLHYDATLASAQHEGFIYGVCTPFQLYDAENMVNLGVWEIPLLVMDGTICSAQYRNLTREQAKESLRQLMAEVMEHKGVFSILWHNSSVCSKRWESWEPFYEEVMEQLSRDFMSASGEEIIEAFERKKADSEGR